MSLSKITSLPKTSHRPLFGIFFLSFLLRFAYFLTHRQESPFFSCYWDLSETLLKQHTLILGGQEITFEPFYPLFLAMARLLTGNQVVWVVLMQLGVCAFGGAVFYRLAYHLSQDERAALWAGVLYAGYPYYVRQAISFNEVSLLTVLLILSCYEYVRLSPRERWFACGTSWALAILTRATVLPIWIFGLAGLVFKKRLREAVLVFLTTLAVLSPVLIRNWRLDGSLLPRRGGIHLFEGNCRYTAALFPAYNLEILSTYAAELARREGRDPDRMAQKQLDGYYTQKALEFMRENPAATLSQRGRNLFFLFFPRLVPYHVLDEKTDVRFDFQKGFEITDKTHRSLTAEIAYSASYGLVFLAALAGLWMRRREWAGQDFILIATLDSFVLVYTVFFPCTRYRAPMDFVLIFYAAVALSRLFHRFRLDRSSA